MFEMRDLARESVRKAGGGVKTDSRGFAVVNSTAAEIGIID
jgi:hypothetical protein